MSSSAAKAVAAAVPDGLEVWVDDINVGPLVHIGRLHRSGQDSVRFEYDPAWLKNIGSGYERHPDTRLSPSEILCDITVHGYCVLDAPGPELTTSTVH